MRGRGRPVERPTAKGKALARPACSARAAGLVEGVAGRGCVAVRNRRPASVPCGNYWKEADTNAKPEPPKKRKAEA